MGTETVRPPETMGTETVRPNDILRAVNGAVSPVESQPVEDSPEATFPLWWTVLGSVRCSLGLS